MRKTLLLLLLFSVKLTYCQFNDDFSDGDFTANPRWSGLTSAFVVNAQQQLKTSLSSVAQVVTLSTPNKISLNALWEFTVQLNFDPSSTNLVRIYLISDQEDLRGSLNGYFIQIGETGTSDSYDLYRQTGNSIVKIIDGPPKNRANSNFLSTKLRITRDDFGKWELSTAITGSSNFNLEGSVVDLTFVDSQFFGIYCRYTATRSEGFMFDDFRVGELVPDQTPPRLLNIKVVDENTLSASFSEAILEASVGLLENYELKADRLRPISVMQISATVVHLVFSSAFASGRYTLLVRGLSDLKGNEMIGTDSAHTSYIVPYIANRGDLVINEILADPSPQIGLPAVEFIELWNTTQHYIDLTGWKYQDISSVHTFLPDTIEPFAYVILCARVDVELYRPFGKTIGLSPWPTLNNDRDQLTLINQHQSVIDEVNYTDVWYKDAVKKQGGYSLELVDPQNRCLGIQNWQASASETGGTPGKQNSIYKRQQTLIPPKLLSITVMDSLSLVLRFDNIVDSLSASVAANYRLNNGIGMPINVIPISPFFESVLLRFDTAIPKGVEHSLSISNLTDCAGNVVAASNSTSRVFIAKDIMPGDVLISEVMVNPNNGAADYVEVYNNTDHVFDLSTLKLANVDANGNVATGRPISSVTVHLLPKTYWVLTSDFASVKQQYRVEYNNHFTELVSMPPYPNLKGSVVITGDFGVIDRFDYLEEMHFPLLRAVKGVALERVSFDRPTNESGNFKSAAQAIGFGTPTFKNSQAANSISKNRVWLKHKVFSPDGDGVDDLLTLNYELEKGDYVGSVAVYNERGMLVKQILRNNTLPKIGTLIWDGTNESGNLNRVGVYIIKFEAFTLDGKSTIFNLACVLAAKLN
ncbi:MAG: lamin tail domain-containing protein [Pedobacter sp.]|nr:MAG: lamin tail domain-containing protein [Pedobacter sp.]